MDVRHEDVLVVASLILVDREAEADGHQFVLGEAAGSRIARKRVRDASIYASKKYRSSFYS